MVMLLMALSVVPAFAGNTYTPVEGTSTTFGVSLLMDAGDTVPNATLYYGIAAGTPISADVANEKMEVLAGITTATKPSIANVVFSHSDIPTTSGTGLVMTHTATVDFTGVTFDEPGIYRYVVTESVSAADIAAGIIGDVASSRILDVYVTDNGSGVLTISSYVLHATAGDVALGSNYGSADVSAAGDPVEDKSAGFTDRLSAKDLKVSLGVTGNQASRDKYFAVTVDVDGLRAGNTYVVSIANDGNENTNDGAADATSGTNSATIAANASKANATSVTGAQLASGVTFYLQHGQSIVIRGLAPDATYTITENAEDYSSAVMTGKTNSGTIGTVAGANKMIEAGFTNTRDGVIPTGVMVSVASGVVLIAVAIIALLILGRKKAEEE